MARIAGVDLPRDKKIQYALPYIFGIGPSNSVRILAETGISPDARVRDLRDAEVARLRQVIERDYKVEGALRTEVAMNIKRLMRTTIVVMKEMQVHGMRVILHLLRESICQPRKTSHLHPHRQV